MMVFQRFPSKELTEAKDELLSQLYQIPLASPYHSISIVT
jgi:hypothetical protein